MLDSLKKFFSPSPKSEQPAGERVAIAAGALLLEMAHIDGEFDRRENDAILNALIQRHGLSPAKAQEIMNEASLELDQSIDLWNFAKTIRDNYATWEKIQVLGTLWDVVLADGIVDRHEDYLIQRLTKLLQLTREECLAAKNLPTKK